MRPTGPVMLAPLSLLTLESVCSRRSRFRTLLERERRPELELDLDSEFLILSHVLVEPPSRFDRDESFDSVRSVSWKPLCLRDKTSSRGGCWLDQGLFYDEHLVDDIEVNKKRTFHEVCSGHYLSTFILHGSRSTTVSRQ